MSLKIELHELKILILDPGLDYRGLGGYQSTELYH